MLMDLDMRGLNMMRIDAHNHFMGDQPETLALLREMDLKMLNICGAWENRPWRQTQRQGYRELAHEHPDRFAWCTTFDLPGCANPSFDAARYADEVLPSLEEDFAQGAVACKVWKNIGMEVRNARGEFIMVDDPMFEPIFKYLASVGKPLLIHNAEPIACWRPLDEPSYHAAYFKNNPEWHLYGRPDVRSHQELTGAEDQLLEQHPGLHVIGAHLGALEFDVARVADRFERFPNYAVDMSARLRDLLCQEASKVRQFFLDYPNRILYGTDLPQQTPHSTLSDEQRQAAYRLLKSESQAHFQYFEGSGALELDGWKGECLSLPQDVLQKFYVDNARAWYPGV